MDKESYSPVSFGRTKREREREGKMKNLLADGTSFLEAINRYQSLVHRENTCDLVAYKFVILV